MAAHPGRFAFSTSHTTRQPRAGEVDGVDYFFVDKSTMEQDIADGKFVEHVEYVGNMYGTSFAAIEQVLANGKSVIVDVETSGVTQLRAKMNPLCIFIAPPSVEQLKARLINRGTESLEAIEGRVAAAALQIEYGLAQNFDLFLINDDLETAFTILESFALVGK